MSTIVLITGGCRSGKSAYARKLAEAMRPRRAYLATCPAIDQEMHRRIEEHRRRRAVAEWETIEEPLYLAGAIGSAGTFNVLLVDCLTLWVNNLMFEAERHGGAVTEQDVADRCGEVLASCATHPGTVFFVTNEVGAGIVPENAIARAYRDLAGRCNQVIAAGADEVILISCGIPLTLKGTRT